MAKMTVLEMTQDILSDMDSDEVNSINDSVESLQVAQILKTTFFNIIEGRDYPHFNELFQFDTVGTSKPNYLKIPETIENVNWVKYDCKKLASDKTLIPIAPDSLPMISIDELPVACIFVFAKFTPVEFVPEDMAVILACAFSKLIKAELSKQIP